MTTWTPKAKAATSYTKLTKHSSSFTTENRAGTAWQYNQGAITYSGTTDSLGRLMYYNSVGIAPTWSNLTKH